MLEDGHLRDVKVVQGPPVFAQAALDAVKQWRYSPFLLDGKPVKTPTRITVDFGYRPGRGRGSVKRPPFGHRAGRANNERIPSDRPTND